MRIVIVLRYFYCPSRPIGGAERQALSLAGKLIEKGARVTVVTGQWDWGQPRREEIGHVPVHRHFTGWGMFNIRGLRKFGQYLYLLTLFSYLIRHSDEYDLIHCHSAMFGASMGVLAGRLLHKKTLVRAMASGPWGDIERLRQERSIKGTGWMLGKLKEADRVVALNKQVARELMEVGVKSERIVHIANGVEIVERGYKTNYALGREIIVIFVGRLHPQKGVDVLLSAFGKVLQDLPHFSWRLMLVGKDAQRHELEELSRQLSIDQEVEFLGQVSDPFPLLGQSDVFVLPSRSEGMSNSLLEAMTHGLPCVVTDIAGNNDVISHNENGLLVRPDDDDGIATALASLAMDRELRERLGQGARNTVREEHSLDSVADRYMALYVDLLQGATS